MSGTRLRTDRELPYRVLDGLTAVLAAFFTVFTIYYAAYLLTNLTVVGIDLKPVIPDDLQFAENAEYVVLFTGWGLAVYYLDYARTALEPDDDGPTGDEEAVPDRTGQVSADGGGTDTPDKPESDRPDGDGGGIRERLATDGPDLEILRRGYARGDPYLAILLAILSVAGTVYIFMAFDRLQGEAFILGFNQTDRIVGAMLIVIVTDATRRAFGWVISAVAVASLIYMHESISDSLPGILAWSGDSWQGIIEEGALGVQSGIYDSTIMGIGSTWVAIFIMFAGMAKAFGLMDFIRSVGTELGGTLRTGVVQIAVVSSMVMGSITGSAAANTATTGSFTIPMIKDQGVRDDFAAAIEAVASAGGQMLPPVMGVAAFLMADIIGVPYLQIVKAGTIPAALFYISVAIAVHFTILKFGWTSDRLTNFDWGVLREGAFFAPPLIVLLYSLIYKGYNPMTAGLYTIATLMVVMLLENGINRFRGRSVDSTVGQTFDGLHQGGIEMAPLVGVLSVMGLIVELLETSGLTGRLGSSITGFADISILGFTGGLALVLVLAMIASIAFGLGMPTPAAYILVAFIVAGGVTELGVPQITTHMFVFYFAMLSAITPPVAISVAVGSRIAGTSFMRSCLQALRLGAPGFLIPFAFVANNSLIEWTDAGLVSFATGTAFAFVAVLAGTVGVIVATVGFDGARDLSGLLRAVFVGLGFLAMFGSIAPGQIVGAVHLVQGLAAMAIIVLLGHARYVVGYQLERVTEVSSPE